MAAKTKHKKAAGAFAPAAADGKPVGPFRMYLSWCASRGDCITSYYEQYPSLAEAREMCVYLMNIVQGFSRAVITSHDGQAWFYVHGRFRRVRLTTAMRAELKKSREVYGKGATA